MTLAAFCWRLPVYFLLLSSSSGIDSGDTYMTFSRPRNKDEASLSLPREEALVALKEWKAQGVRSEALTYVVRNVNFTHLARGKPVLPRLAPIADAFGKMLLVLQHHEVFFTLKGPSTAWSPGLHLDNVSSELGRRLTEDKAESTKLIKVHMQIDGIYVNIYDEMPPMKSWRWDVASDTDLETIIDFVADDRHAKYQFMWWNCQQFAYGLVSALQETCRNEKHVQCLPEDLEAHLPLMVYEGKLWYVMFFMNVVGTCAIGLVTLRVLWWAGQPLVSPTPKGEPLLADA